MRGLLAIFVIVDDTFSHKIDLKVLQKELGMSAEEIGRFLQMKNPKGVYNWSKDKATDGYGSRPSYYDSALLLQKGATVKTLFGVDYDAIHNLVPASQPEPEPVLAAPTPEFLKARPELLEGMREQLLEMGFVSKDQIEDLVRQTIERKSGGKV